MNITDETLLLAENITSLICDIFCVDTDCVNTSTKGSKESDARAFIWYILHYEYELSLNQLAELHKREARVVTRCIARIRDRIEIQTYYKQKHIIIQETIKATH